MDTRAYRCGGTELRFADKADHDYAGSASDAGREAERATRATEPRVDQQPKRKFLNWVAGSVASQIVAVIALVLK